MLVYQRVGTNVKPLLFELTQLRTWLETRYGVLMSHVLGHLLGILLKNQWHDVN